MNTPRTRLILFTLAGLLLAACGTLPRPPAATPPTAETEVALFSDSDLDQAVLALATSEQTPAYREAEALALEQPDEPAATSSWHDEASDEPANDELSPQGAPLAGASGYTIWVDHRPNAARPWRLRLRRESDGSSQLVYAGRRSIDSAAVGADGDTVVFAAAETTSPSSDTELYRLDLTAHTSTRLTRNAVDDTDVSLSADAATIVWEGGMNRRNIRIRQGGVTTRLASQVHDFIQPSVSGDGNFIAFIRQRSAGGTRVVRFDRRSATATHLTGWTGPGRAHPSVSDGGAKVAYLQLQPSGAFRIRVRDVGAGTTSTAAASQASSPLDHPHLTADGNWLIYARTTATGRSQLWVVDLLSGSRAQVISSATPRQHSAPYWQLSSGFHPTRDTRLPGGHYSVGSVSIPAGVTVTFEGEAFISVTGTTDIAGVVRSEAGKLTVQTGGELTVTGTIALQQPAGSASLPPNLGTVPLKDQPAGLFLIVQGGATIAQSAKLRSYGPLVITDDPTVLDRTMAQVNREADSASGNLTTLVPLPADDPIFNKNQVAAAVPSAITTQALPTISLSGDWDFSGIPGDQPTVVFRFNFPANLVMDDFELTSPAGVSAEDIDTSGDPTQTGRDVTGEDGKRGMNLNIWNNTGSITLRNTLITLADGGDGSSVTLTCATATGGDGAEAGNFRVAAAAGIRLRGVVIIQPGSSGDGGSATSLGVDGCNTVAVGGDGADNEKRLYVRGQVSGLDRLIISDLVAGDGGMAVAVAGDGANGALCNDGGAGGNATATGGDGGAASLNFSGFNQVTAGFVFGGLGGEAGALGGTGGDGGNCQPDAAGDGGLGGNAIATGGKGANASAGGGAAAIDIDGDGGNAAADGGFGGNGGNACNPPQPGGSGGAGGNAISIGGLSDGDGLRGSAASLGGFGGDGGDGVPAGAFGFRGTATAAGRNPIQLDGLDGEFGEWCPLEWFGRIDIPEGETLAGLYLLDVYPTGEHEPTGDIIGMDVRDDGAYYEVLDGYLIVDESGGLEFNFSQVERTVTTFRATLTPDCSGEGTVRLRGLVDNEVVVDRLFEVGPGANVLEIGYEPGFDDVYLEAEGTEFCLGPEAIGLALGDPVEPAGTTLLLDLHAIPNGTIEPGSDYSLPVTDEFHNGVPGQSVDTHFQDAYSSYYQVEAGLVYLSSGGMEFDLRALSATPTHVAVMVDPNLCGTPPGTTITLRALVDNSTVDAHEITIDDATVSLEVRAADGIEDVYLETPDGWFCIAPGEVSITVLP